MQDPMQSPEQNPGPDPGPGPGPSPGEQPGPMPGQYPGPGPGPKAAGGPSALSDPPSARPLRMAVIALGALCLALLIAGTAVDEYTGASTHGAFSYDKTSWSFGCQNVVVKKKSMYLLVVNEKLPFKYMNVLSFLIILTTSFLCVLQAVAIGLNVAVLLLGKLQKAPLIVSSIIPLLLLVAIVMANINFSGKRFHAQSAGLPHYQTELQEAKKAKESVPATTTRDPYGGSGRGKRSPDGAREPSMPNILMFDAWGSSYYLICAAAIFAVLNQILLIALHKMAKNGASSGGFGGLVKALELSPAKIVRVVIFLVNLLLLALMVTGIGLDSYIDGGLASPCLIGAMNNGCNGAFTHNDTLKIEKMKTEMKEKELVKFVEKEKLNYANIAPMFMNAHAIAIVVFALTTLVCVTLLAATALCLVQMIMEKNLTLPLLGVSGVSAFLLLISVVLACVEFKASNHEGNILIGTGALTSQQWNTKHNITEKRTTGNMDDMGPSGRRKRDNMERALAAALGLEIEERVSFAVSFHILATALAFALVNAGLNAVNMFVLNKGENGPAKPAPTTMKVASTQPSSAGVGPSPLEATCQNPTEATCQNPTATA